ncbi:MAG: hypothetical protein M1816_001092 [Peltula sp. TS41687]|nr:MAG: hypothetical protein M1816_001092 [Peltula sp. TS41687]
MTTKADRYIALLDAARCNGDWEAVPEITRKLNKHAPHRHCLIESARAEYSLALSIIPGGRNATADPQQFIPALRTAIQSEKIYDEEVLQAQVCLIWLSWTLRDLSSVQAHSPWPLIHDYLKGEQKPYSDWTKVSIIKGLNIIGNTWERRTERSEALRVYASALPLINRTLGSSAGIEFEAWSERLLAAYCLLSSHLGASNLDGAAIKTLLKGFRVWASLWANRKDQISFTAIGGNIVGTNRARRQIWSLYHSLLSTILQHDLLYPPCFVDSGRDSGEFGSIEAEGEDAVANSRLRAQLKDELQRAQETYEGLLLAETSFPSADEVNEEIQRWAGVVMENWRTLCCEDKSDEWELGEGGKDSYSRTVLDILYRAAAKSFHSTSILRHLFTVHAFLDEFDLAIKALETYIELVKKGRSRVLKSGKPEPNLDQDEMVLQTASQGVKYLCSQDGERAAVRAKEVGNQIKMWLEESKEREEALAEAELNGAEGADEQSKMGDQKVSKHVLASGYRAVGISEAHWSRTTYGTEAREDMRQQALLNLQGSVSAYYEDTDNPESVFALGLLLAESLELDKAVAAVKQALLRQAHALKASIPELSEAQSSLSTNLQLASSTKYIPLWHLLVLLLSAAQDFDTALETCEGVIAQFDSVLQPKDEIDANGSVNTGGPNDSSMRQNSQKPSPKQTRDILSRLESQEKEAMLQIKMTQLTLIEVIEDSETAVNASEGLLRLYSVLYGAWTELRYRSGPVVPAPTKASRISSGTLKTIRQSLFGKSKTTRQSLRHLNSSFSLGNTRASSVERVGEAQERDASQSNPQIQVVNEYDQVTDSIGNDFRHNLTVQTVGRSHHRKLHKQHRSWYSTMGSTSLHPRQGLAAASSDVGGGSRPLSVHSSIMSGASGQMVMSQGRNAISSDNIPQFPESRPRSPDNQAGQAGLGMSNDTRSAQQDTSSTDERQLHKISIRGNPLSRAPSGRGKYPAFGSDGPQNHVMQLLSDEPGLGTGSRSRKGPFDHRRYSLLIKIWLFIAGLYRRATLYEDAKGAIDEALTVLECLEGKITAESSTFGAWAVNDESLSRRIDELRADVLTERGYLAQARSLDQDALEYFEQAVSCCIDHPPATVGLCAALLDYSSGQTTRRPDHSHSPLYTDGAASSSAVSVSNPPMASTSTSNRPPNSNSIVDPSPAPPGREIASQESLLELDRLAARDRAYGLLRSLTKLAVGCDLSSAWFELSRVYEQSGQVEKEREALWRCVELEDRKPVRHWRNAETRGYVL